MLAITSRISSSSFGSLLPSVTWFEIWYRSPLARLPSPYSPRTTRLSFCRALNTLSSCLVMPSAGRCSITLARSPVPTLVGQAVR